MIGFIDFITKCDMCYKDVGTENLLEFIDKKTGDDWYFCEDCMKEVRRIRRRIRKLEKEGKPYEEAKVIAINGEEEELKTL